jgi:hypothetical protein
VDENDVTDDTVYEVEVPAAPWHNSDTVAASFTFAANLALSAAQHFAQLSQLALGQSGHEWAEEERAGFEQEVTNFIAKLPEGGAQDG